jgi:hypothetical protein
MGLPLGLRGGHDARLCVVCLGGLAHDLTRAWLVRVRVVLGFVLPFPLLSERVVIVAREILSW